MTATSTRPIAVASYALGKPSSVSPARLGFWSLQGLLARGSVADLYLAQAADQSSSKGQRYVVKVLRREWREHALVRQQFSSEAALGQQLTSPHLAAVLHADLQNDPPYLVMPLIEGQTVAALIRRESTMPIALKLAILRQTALGLAALHAVDYLHGDLKPENLLLSPSGHLTLIDLGSVRPICESGSIWNRPVLGSPAYMAPELFTSSLPRDIRSDLYSLGVIGYELIAERHPYPQEKAGNYATAAKQTRPAGLRQFAPQIPSQITALIDSLLAKQPSRRPTSAHEVVERLMAAELMAWQFWTAA
jgi:eukaryotic-like serine/threonine-protein kinase